MLIKLRLSVAENTAKLKVAQVRLLHASPPLPLLQSFYVVAYLLYYLSVLKFVLATIRV